MLKNHIILTKISENLLPQQCPSCQNELQVDQLHCPSCETEVFGNFRLPFMARLTADEQEFIKMFILHSGSLKAMAQQLNQSYPTVRGYLDDLISRLKQLEGEYQQQNGNPNS